MKSKKSVAAVKGNLPGAKKKNLCLEKLQKLLVDQKDEEQEEMEKSMNTEEEEEVVMKKNPSGKKKAPVSASVLTTVVKALPSNKKKDVSKGGISQTSECDDSELLDDAKILSNGIDLRSTYFSDLNPNDPLKFKIIVTALELKRKDSSIKNAILKKSGISPYGAVHTAVHIGSCILEWNFNSLIIPLSAAEFFNRKTLAAVDLEVPAGTDSPEDLIQKACDVVARWNGNYSYDRAKKNCQHFTNELLATLGLSQKFSGKMKKFMDSLTDLDKNNIAFEFSFTETGPPLQITSHSMLDEECGDKLDGKPKTCEDYRLLKAFDRVFWLRYLGVMHSQNLTEVEKQPLLEKYRCHKLGCFFGNPAETDTQYGASFLTEEEEEE